MAAGLYLYMHMFFFSWMEREYILIVSLVVVSMF
jgi:hypothetical protein